MRTLLAIAGVLLVLVGLVWLLQGIGILPGSFMTGQLKWAVCGAVSVVAGVLVIAVSRRRSRA
jgi:hypothetical protein